MSFPFSDLLKNSAFQDILNQFTQENQTNIEIYNKIKNFPTSKKSEKYKATTTFIDCPICLESSSVYTTFNCQGKHPMCNNCYRDYVDSCHGKELKCVLCREVMESS
jgi:hypothetical protein